MAGAAALERPTITELQWPTSGGSGVCGEYNSTTERTGS